MNLEKDAYILGFWFVPISPHEEFPRGGDLLIQVIKKQETPNDWIGEFRFRLYNSTDVWDQKDEKRFYEMNMKDTPESIVEFRTTMLAEKMAKQFNGGQFEYFSIRGGVDIFSEKIKSNPPSWMHVKTFDMTNEKEKAEVEKLIGKKEDHS